MKLARRPRHSTEFRDQGGVVLSLSLSIDGSSQTSTEYPKTFPNIWEQGSIGGFIPLHTDMRDEKALCVSAC